MLTTNTNFEKMSFDILVEKNSGQFEYQFDILILFIHYFMMENDFYIHQNNQVRTQSSQSNKLFL